MHDIIVLLVEIVNIGNGRGSTRKLSSDSLGPSLLGHRQGKKGARAAQRGGSLGASGGGVWRPEEIRVEGVTAHYELGLTLKPAQLRTFETDPAVDVSGGVMDTTKSESEH